jgi:hypothetical protein
MAAYVVFNTTLLELKKEKKQKTFFFVMHPSAFQNFSFSVFSSHAIPLLIRYHSALELESWVEAKLDFRKKACIFHTYESHAYSASPRNKPDTRPRYTRLTKSANYRART